MTKPYFEGQALVASPYLADRNFLRSVVYIVKHDSEGAYGLILNRPTELTVSELLRQLADGDTPELADGDTPEVSEDASLTPIYYGGPVDGPIVVLHEIQLPAASLVEDGIFLSSDQEDLATVCKQTASRFRVFNGYAGWAPEQLDDEFKQGGWLLWNLTKEELFSPPDEIWQEAIRQIGRDILAEGIAIDRIPKDPSAN